MRTRLGEVAALSWQRRLLLCAALVLLVACRTSLSLSGLGSARRVIDGLATPMPPFGPVGDPDRIDIVSTAREQDLDVEDVWEDASRWKTLLARRNLLEDALDREQDRYLNSSSGDSDEDSTQKRPV